MHILFLSRWFPYPANNGSKLRILNLLRGLAVRHRVSLLSFADEIPDSSSLLEMHAICDCLNVVPWKSFKPQSWRARWGYLSLTPRAFFDTFSTEMVQQVGHILTDDKYNLVIGSQLTALSYAPYFQGLPALLEESELGVYYGKYIDSRTIKQRFRAALTLLKLRHFMASKMKYFHGATVVSEPERQLLSKVAPDLHNVEVVPNCVTVADYAIVKSNPKPNSLVFTGPFQYMANYEGIVWFLRDVYPLIQLGQPNVNLTITGDHQNLPLPSAPNVTLTGYVEDVKPYIANSWCSIVPLHTGGGTRLKILEAMALHTPVVTTTKGAEGLGAEHEKHLLIANTPQAFAQSVLRLFHEPGLREKLAENSYRLVRNQYDWSAVMPRFLDLVERVAGS